MDESTLRRFMEKVEKQTEVTSPHVDTPCWLWTGHIKADGCSGYLRTGHSSRPAAALAYEHWNTRAAKPKAKRLCKSPVCVNPKHLYTTRDLTFPIGGKMSPSLLNLFLQNLPKRIGECWEWQGFKSPSGYGVMNIKRGGRARPWLSHRLAFEHWTGPAEGMSVCHHCDNPTCCEPKHLFLGTAADNAADMVAKGRSTIGQSRPQTSGELHGCAQLSESDVHRIRALIESGRTQVSIADEFGMSSSTISHIHTGRLWKHLV